MFQMPMLTTATTTSMTTTKTMTTTMAVTKTMKTVTTPSMTNQVLASSDGVT